MFRLLSINLQLHDGAPAPAAAPAAATAPSATQQAPGKAPKTVAAEKVVYGKQDTPPAAPTTDPKPTNATSNTLEARKAEFEKLIGGEFKDLYAEKFQQGLDRRFKDTKSLQTQLDGMNPVMEMLAQKYNVTDSDPKKILEAIEKDSKYWEAAAEEAGLTVEQYKAQKKMERENVELKKAQQRIEQDTAARNQLSEWMRQGDQLKASTVPGFDLSVESRNPQFTSLLRSGVDVKTAYNVIHMDDIISGVAQTAGQQATKATVDNIQAKQQRPNEAGATPSPGIVVKNDVSQLTAADRRAAIEENRRRVARGETPITFG